MATDVGHAPGLSEIVTSVAEHFDQPPEQLLAGASLERDIAIWIVRHWTEESTRAIAEAFRCSHQTVTRADERIAQAMSDDPITRARVHRAEDHVAEAFPMEDEDA